MCKFLSMILAAVLFLGGISYNPMCQAAEGVPDAAWAETYGWEKENDRYVKTVDGITYELWCGKNAFDKLCGNDFNWQIVTGKSENLTGVIMIPGELDGFSVKCIGGETFRANEAITECVIAEGVEVLAAGAFENCRNLTAVALPETLKMLDSEAFYNCPNLRSLTIPAAVEYVSRTAFCGKTASGEGLKNLTFEGNAPQVLYQNASGKAFTGIDDTTIYAYENTTGWNLELWSAMGIQYLQNIPQVTPEVTVTPEITQAPEVTVTPEITQAPEVTVTPEVTQAPEVTVTPEKSVTDLFEDVYADWYTRDLQLAYDQGYMTGIEGTKLFRPNSSLTKAQAVQVIYQMAGSPDYEEDYSVYHKLGDVYYKEWYAKSLSWAYQNGIITGDLSTYMFYPNSGITREQLALVFFRYAQYRGLETDARDGLKKFENTKTIHIWAQEAVEWAAAVELLQGFEVKNEQGIVNGWELKPQETASRAQMAALIQRFLNIENSANE